MLSVCVLSGHLSFLHTRAPAVHEAPITLSLRCSTISILLNDVASFRQLFGDDFCCSTILGVGTMLIRRRSCGVVDR